ncbi:hypothetical protein [Parapedobacter sp. 2B3]|uniref:hypothetical protein n=1 Tax=Parapedobacter sp. 2B3 TaxID=3342381 RepID=UPI0035B5E62A
MENSDLQLKDTDIATAVAYYGETELLDFIGITRIQEYLALVLADQDGTGEAMGLWAKVFLHQRVASAKVELGDKYKMTVQADFVDNNGNEVVIVVRMDRILGLLFQQRAAEVA